jgi:ATPase subunit of ABC transporter with duplicated ATPase domains
MHTYPYIHPFIHFFIYHVFIAGTAVGQHDAGTRQEESAQRGYLANFGISGPRAVIPVKYLSGGQRMRVAMAVSLARKPDVLILGKFACA